MSARCPATHAYVLFTCIVMLLVGCSDATRGEDDAGHMHDDASVGDAHVHEDATEEDAHAHDDASTLDAHAHDDAGMDAAAVAMPIDACLRIDGVGPTEVCDDPAVHDPDGDGWGWQDEMTCVVATNPVVLLAPFCDTPIPPSPFEAAAATVIDSTTSVATLPRPAHVSVPPPTDCPYDAAGLVTVSPSWLDAQGTLQIPAGTHAILHGNAEIPAATLISLLHVPATSELVLADMPTTLRITDAHIEGALRLGSPTCRLQSAITITFDTNEDVADETTRAAIVARAGLGMMVMADATLDVFGKLYQPTWTRLAATAAPMATQLRTAEPVDWEPGQQLVIATSSRVDYPLAAENEVRAIATIAPTPGGPGSTITFSQPLLFNHYGGSEYQVEVGLLSRSIRFTTSSAVLAAAPTFGGFTMFHGGHARVSGVELYGMGQQNMLGRYPIHFHRAGDVNGGTYFTDSSVWRSNYRCAVVHRTNRSIVSRNVAYDVFGHCYYLEDGVEMDNEISFNLAVRPKILGPVDAPSIGALRGAGQEGFTLDASPEITQPADRAAAGFYISNGNNQVFGNAASGGFAGFSFPNLPVAIGGSEERIFPLRYGVSDFDGNTAHSSSYLWGEGGACLYVGGVLTEVPDGQGGTKLRYLSGRTTDPSLLRRTTEVFNNTKTFLCEHGMTHWGGKPRLVNFEAWDNAILAQVFGTASIQSAVVSLASGNPGASDRRVLRYWSRGFQFYDTVQQTILRDIVFRNFQHDPYAGMFNDQDTCALVSMTHSDQWTPQRMNVVAGIHYFNVDLAQRICVGNTGTLSSRNFNFVDADGSASRYAGDGLPPTGARLVGSGYVDSWRFANACVKNIDWGTWTCPLAGSQNVASIRLEQNAGVNVKLYRLDNAAMGDTYYSATNFTEAQITGPSAVGWHHSFPGGVVPPYFDVHALQVPDASFVLMSFSLPPGVTCSINGWSAAPSLDALRLLTGAAYAYVNAQNACILRIPPTNVGDFTASGLSVPNFTPRWSSPVSAVFRVSTGCTAGNAACQSVVSTVPVFPP